MPAELRWWSCGARRVSCAGDRSGRSGFFGRAAERALAAADGGQEDGSWEGAWVRKVLSSRLVTLRALVAEWIVVVGRLMEEFSRILAGREEVCCFGRQARLGARANSGRRQDYGASGSNFAEWRRCMRRDGNKPCKNATTTLEACAAIDEGGEGCFGRHRGSGEIDKMGPGAFR